MTDWTLNPEYAVGPTGEAFASLDSVFALQGEFITRDPLSEVIRVQVGGRRYYLKRYHGSGKHLRRFIGRPRVLSEWRNLLLFQSWGIPAATVVAFGLERRGGLFHRGALITEELQDTADLAELAAAGRPALLIPLPHAIDDHQTANARYLADRGAAELLPQKTLTAELLAQRLGTLLGKPETVRLMAEQARKQARPNATADVVRACLEVAREH